MDRLKRFNDAQLKRYARRLERDIENFRVRVVQEAAALERMNRCVDADPLHHRLSSIHAFLEDQLNVVKAEIERRAAVTAVRRPGALQSLLRALVFRTMLRSRPLRRRPIRMTP